MEGSNIPSIPYLMASNTFTRCTISGSTQHTRKGTQGRPKEYDDVYGQRLFAGDSARIKAMGYSRNDLVRLATHKFLEDLENNVHTELVNT